ncbi:alpha/beta fold hydrolase [uncultured Sphingomonas sp.]|uniref:alpha/beta fold hydrolase n=1 Tax=uncultured Sphingomonas sp. TaxID=158754 RepID=UPI0035C9B3D9
MIQKPEKSAHAHSAANLAPAAGPRPPVRPWRWGAAAGVGGLFATAAAVFNRASTRRAEAETPPAGAFVEVDGVRLHYVERGEGPVVVLLHGNGVMLQDFEVSGVLDLAAARHRVLAFDRPGFGHSDRPRSTVWTPSAQAALLARALQQLGVERAVFVGHSWGTMVALAMALDHPDLIGGLVLISGYYYGTARPDVVPASTPAIPLLGDLLAATVSPLLARITGPLGIKASFAPAPIPDKFSAFPVAMTLRPSQIRATAADTAMMVPAAVMLSRRYAELSVPVVIMAGDGDLIVHKARHADRLAQEVAAADLRVIPGQGHLLHYAVPEQVVTAIHDVLSRNHRQRATAA